MILANPNPIFQPAMRIISSITNSYPAIVTTTFAHQYTTGIIARLNIPNGFGMRQANQLYASIIVIDETTFSIDIDTRYFEPFITPVIVGTTDGSGNSTGNISGTSLLIGVGQTFTIDDQTYTVITKDGALSTTSTGSGTMNLNTGDFTFTGAAASEDIYWNQIGFPQNRQYPTVTAIGEINSLLNAAERNVLPFGSDF